MKTKNYAKVNLKWILLKQVVRLDRRGNAFGSNLSSIPDFGFSGAEYSDLLPQCLLLLQRAMCTCLADMASREHS
jgi:hypothetical protein